MKIFNDILASTVDVRLNGTAVMRPVYVSPVEWMTFWDTVKLLEEKASRSDYDNLHSKVRAL